MATKKAGKAKLDLPREHLVCSYRDEKGRRCGQSLDASVKALVEAGTLKRDGVRVEYPCPCGKKIRHTIRLTAVQEEAPPES